jgi:hypothetical protein
MRDAGLNDAQILDRLRATNQVFELTLEQRQSLLDRGVSRFVVDQMETINKATRDRLLTLPPPTAPPVGTPPVISQPAGTYPPPTYPPTSYPPGTYPPPRY